MDPTLRVYEPWVLEEDVMAVAAALRGGWLARGPHIERFERRFAARCNTNHGIAVANGTLALELALRALDIGPGDEVICPSLTIISCALAIIRVGARPVFVDVDDSWTLDPSRTNDAITRRTRAILGVHLYGHAFHPDIVSAARKHGIYLVEDAAEALGTQMCVDDEWHPCGSVSDVGVFSLYANKAVTSGEGGVCVTSDPNIARRLRSLRNLCFETDRRFRHAELGINARLSNVAAALALSQLPRLDDILAAKKSVYSRYRARLSGAPLDWHRESSWELPIPWMVACVLTDEAPIDAAQLSRRLASKGIETRPFFWGMHEQPALANYVAGGDFPIASRLSRRGLYLPSDPRILDSNVDRVANAIFDILAPSRQSPPTKPRAATQRSAAPFGRAYAHLYDALYDDKPYESEVRSILSLAQRHGVHVARAIDFGCGTGRHLEYLAAAGLDATGVDSSPDMIARAKIRLRDTNARVRVERTTDVREPAEFDLALMLFGVLSYHDGADVWRALNAARSCLRNDGLLIAEPWFGPSVLADPPQRRSQHVRVDGVQWIREASPEHDPMRQLVHVDYRIRRLDDASSAVGERHTLRYFFPRELESALHSAGFELLSVGAHAEEPNAAYPTMVVARAK